MRDLETRSTRPCWDLQGLDGNEFFPVHEHFKRASGHRQLLAPSSPILQNSVAQ